MFEGITQLIEENTTEDSVIFGYPYVKIFNILTDNYNMNTFVPVLFYDVVDDKYVQEEKALLEENGIVGPYAGSNPREVLPADEPDDMEDAADE